MRTGIVLKKIIAVIDATFLVAKRKSEKIQAFVFYNCDDVLSCNSKFNIKYIKVKNCFVFIAYV